MISKKTFSKCRKNRFTFNPLFDHNIDGRFVGSFKQELVVEFLLFVVDQHHPNKVMLDLKKLFTFFKNN